MAFNRLMLTTDGKILYAKAQQGKTLQFTRVGIGEGDIGSGSLVNRTALISEKLSLLVDMIQLVNENESAIITTLKNENLAEGFYFREIGIFAKDPDTQQEKLYLYDNAGQDGEYIPDNQSGVIVNERLKFLLLLENVTTVSFVPSGNPIYLNPDDIDDTVFSEASLWSSSKTKAEIDAAINTAAMDATSKTNAVQANLATHMGTDATTVVKGHVQLGTGAAQAAAGNHNHSGVYAPATHNHAAGDITSGTLPIARGGTGATTAAAALTALGLTATAAELNYTGGVTSPIQTQLNNRALLAPSVVSVSAGKTLALSDAGTVQNCTNAAAITITIPANATVAFAVGTEIAIIRQGAGAVSIAPASGVTLNSDGGKRSIKSQYTSVALKKTATDTWILVGNLSA
jgi:hypothetical protein